MNNEYIIVNKTKILEEIEELKASLNYIPESYVAKHLAQIYVYEQVLLRSTPLIPENVKPLQELVDEGYDPHDSAHHLQVQKMLKVIENYISNLKLDI
jgi:tRNA splicing ligase